MRARLLMATAVLVLCAAPLRAQAPDLDPTKPPLHPLLPTIAFSFEFAGAIPGHYTLMLESTGRAAYWSDSPAEENQAYQAPGKTATDEPFVERLTISQSTADRIFDLAQKLNYFQGDFDYKKTRVANTGIKKLTYADPARRFETTYNWSQTVELMTLTRLLQAISSTLEFHRRIRHELRYQKLALDDELKQLQDAATHDDAAELQILAPTLQKIVKDTSLLHIVRRRAAELLATLPGAGQ